METVRTFVSTGFGDRDVHSYNDPRLLRSIEKYQKQMQFFQKANERLTKQKVMLDNTLRTMKLELSEARRELKTKTTNKNTRKIVEDALSSAGLSRVQIKKILEPNKNFYKE